MNATGRPPERPATNPITASNVASAGDSGHRLAIVCALEALEVGDQAYAVDVLLGALEDGVDHGLTHRCECGNAYEWPGQLDAHRVRSGHEPQQSWQVAA